MRATDMALSCDLFCTVVDNLGDAGVCWRLARQLAAEHGWRVRLWIDHVAPLAGLQPGIDPLLEVQQAEGVEVRRWHQDFPAVEPGDVVIEAFACALPETFVAAMVRRDRAPVWLNLEYLSAEPWVAGCHGLASPHPTLPLVKHFFFPGFTPDTGGLLRERDADFAPDRPAEPGHLRISLFCYDNPALPRLLDAWRDDGDATTCRVAHGLPRRQVEAWLGEPFAVGTTIHRDALTLVAEPFVPQPGFDRRLGACDLNFVRGEDSFVRAQWAGRPLVWQIYPQGGDAHRVKLEAFLDLYLDEGASRPAREAALAFWKAWNGYGSPESIGAAWPALRTILPDLASHAGAWAEGLAKHGNLAENLALFCEERL